MIKKIYLKSDFIKSVAVLMTGTLLAQGLGILVMPLLTRIYEPEAFGELNIYMRLIGFVSGVATARFEMSLPLPKYEGHSFLLYELSLRIAAYSLLAMAIIGGLYFLIQPVSVYNISFLLISIGSTFFVIFINLGTNWSIRKKAFKDISRQKIVGSVSSNGLRLLFGYLSFGSLGLLLGTMIGYVVSSVWYIRDFVNLRNRAYKNYSKKKKKVLVKEYSEFPMVNLPHVSLDLGRELFVAALVSYHFGLEIFGLYSVSQMILKMPLTILGTSIGQVFYGETSQMVNQGKSVYSILRRTILTLFGLSILPFSLIYFFGEPIFEFILGKDFGPSGYYSEIMATWLMMVFIVSPISNLSLVLRRQKEYFLLGLVGSSIQLFCFGVLPLIYGSGESVWIFILWVVTIAQTINFTMVCFVSLYYAKKGAKSITLN